MRDNGCRHIAICCSRNNGSRDKTLAYSRVSNWFWYLDPSPLCPLSRHVLWPWSVRPVLHHELLRPHHSRLLHNNRGRGCQNSAEKRIAHTLRHWRLQNMVTLLENIETTLFIRYYDWTGEEALTIDLGSLRSKANGSCRATRSAADPLNVIVKSCRFDIRS